VGGKRRGLKKDRIPKVGDCEREIRRGGADGGLVLVGGSRSPEGVFRRGRHGKVLVEGDQEVNARQLRGEGKWYSW